MNRPVRKSFNRVWAGFLSSRIIGISLVVSKPPHTTEETHKWAYMIGCSPLYRSLQKKNNLINHRPSSQGWAPECPTYFVLFFKRGSVVTALICNRTATFLTHTVHVYVYIIFRHTKEVWIGHWVHCTGAIRLTHPSRASLAPMWYRILTELRVVCNFWCMVMYRSINLCSVYTY